MTPSPCSPFQAIDGRARSRTTPQVLVKVIDILGNDTTKSVRVRVE